MPKGMLKFFNVDRGYGFIAPDDGAADIFVHITAVEAAGMGRSRKARSSRSRLKMTRDLGRQGRVS
jgi:CspA family cold shock protein